MNDATHDAPLFEWTDPALVRPLPPALHGARADVMAAARDLLAIPNTALAQPWNWIGGSETEIRYGAYRAAEGLETAEIEARAALPAAAHTQRVAQVIGPATAARWVLHGLLLPLDDAQLDADPGGGEWTLRLVLGHTISSQRGYAWGNAWILGHADGEPDASGAIRVPEAFWAALPDEATSEAEGTMDDLRARFDAILDLSTERLAGLPEHRLATWTGWAGFKVTLGFRFGRWASHIREHSIQVEKTFSMLGYVPDEPAYLARNLLAAYGRAEAVVFGQKDADVAVSRIVRGSAEALAVIRSARDAAGA